MATDRATLAYRPDKDEKDLLQQIAERYGLSMSRAIGIAVREKAERDGLKPRKQAKSEEAEGDE